MKKSVFLKAEHQNWGLHTAWDWQEDIFELSADGDLHIVVRFYKPVVDCVVKVSESDMEKLRALIACASAVGRRVDACDGDAWSFSAYNERGKQIFHYELGHIYGIREMEEIGKILCSYIPDYEEPSLEECLEWEESRGIGPSLTVGDIGINKGDAAPGTVLGSRKWPRRAFEI